MLEDFYFNGGGKEVIPRRLAMRRLGQEAYRAGRYALKEGHVAEARTLFAQSLRWYPHPKTLFNWARSIVRS